MNKISSILHRANSVKPYNILTFCTHERYETGLAKTGHNFFAFRGQHIKDWNTTYAPVPKNYTLLNPLKKDKQIPLDIDFDFVLSQNKFGQFQIAKQISYNLGIPLISLEHTLPVPNMPVEQLQLMNSMRGDIDVFISEFSRKRWGWKEQGATVIHHGIDTELFTSTNNERRNVCLSVVNDWVNRDVFCGYYIWKRITKGLPVYVLGDTPGLSKAAKNTSELVKAYQTSRIFINTSTVSPVPTALLEAMACGCACVTTATCMIPEIVKNDYNGFISNNESELRQYIEILLNDEEKAKELGNNARQTILENFSMDNFIKNWNNTFDKAMEF